MDVPIGFSMSHTSCVQTKPVQEPEAPIPTSQFDHAAVLQQFDVKKSNWRKAKIACEYCNL